MLIPAEKKTKIARKLWKSSKTCFNERLQILEEFSNVKSSFLTEVKSFKNELLQSYVTPSPSKQVHRNLMSEILERFINHLEEQISFLRGQLRNKDKIINSLINQFSKKWGNTDTNYQSTRWEPIPKNSGRKYEPVKQKLSPKTEIIQI